jgi:hypothetical protein
MQLRSSILERAYELALTGDCANTDAVRRLLKAEGYTNVDMEISGRTLTNALARICREKLRGGRSSGARLFSRSPAPGLNRLKNCA